jgi:hypothetical protein
MSFVRDYYIKGIQLDLRTDEVFWPSGTNTSIGQVKTRFWQMACEANLDKHRNQAYYRFMNSFQ